MTIEHLQHQGKLGVGPEYDEARVALVTATDNRFLKDLARNFENRVEWNGRSATLNRPDHFATIGTETTATKFTDVVNALLAFAPHIIVGATDDEMSASIMPVLEENWDSDSARAAQGRPFYLLSPKNYQGPRNALFQKSPGARQRILGINWPATLGTAAYNEYKSAYQTEYPSGKNYDQENFYDAVYFLLYGMVATGPQGIRGDTIAGAMPRITASSGTPFNVGAADLSDGFSFLSTNIKNKINLTGANGAPRWNAGGGRDTPASVWCIDNNSLYVPDVLSYDPDSETLTGTVPSTCFTFPAP